MAYTGEYRHLGRVYPERPSVERDMTLATLAAAGITTPPRMAEGYRSHSRPLGSVEGWAVSLLTRRQMLDAMTAFYSSPEGASILKKTPQVMAMSMQEIQPIIRDAMAEVKATIDEELAAPKSKRPRTSSAPDRQ